MIMFLITVLVVILVAGVLCWVVGLLPIPQPYNRIIQVIIALIAVLYLLQAFVPALRLAH